MTRWQKMCVLCVRFNNNGHKRIAKFFAIAKPTPFKYNNTKNVYNYRRRKSVHTQTHELIHTYTTRRVCAHCTMTKYGIPNELQILILLIGRVLLTEWSNLFAIRLARFNESIPFIQKLNHKHTHTHTRSHSHWKCSLLFLILSHSFLQFFSSTCWTFLFRPLSHSWTECFIFAVGWYFFSKMKWASGK